MEIKIVKKPWGEEVWFAQTEHYAGKILRVNKGHRYSLQFHEKKIETQYLFKGKIKFIHGDSEENLQETIMTPGQKVDVFPGTIHRVEAIEDSEIFEVSTPELDDVVKLHDDYGRTGSGNNFQNDLKLHNQLRQQQSISDKQTSETKVKQN